MNAYEQSVLQTWLRDAKQPEKLPIRLTRQFSGGVGRIVKTIEKINHKKTQDLYARLQGAAKNMIIKVLEQSATIRQLERVENEIAKLGGHAENASEIRLLPLEIKDEVARRLAHSQTITVSAEGVTAGFLTSLFELVPGLQGLVVPTILADLYATIRMLAQSAVQIGYSYGYNLHNEEDLAHFLVAMAPTAADARVIEAKLTAHLAARESAMVAARALGQHLTVSMLASGSPFIGSLVDALATRIALYFIEKEGSLLIPIAGAVLQGAINASFARMNYQDARRYFQRLHLIDRYGEDYLEERLAALRTGTA